MVLENTFATVVADGSFILFGHFHNLSLENPEEAFWAFCVCSTQYYVSLKLGVCWQMGSLVRSILSSLCVGQQQQGLPSSRLVQLVDVPYALLQRHQLPLSYCSEVCLPIKFSSLASCATHIHSVSYCSADVQTVPTTYTGPYSEGAG